MRVPKPNQTRINEGMRGHRPLRREAQHALGIPQQPKSMSAGARKIWDRLVEDMDPAILRRSDQDALAALCEDQSLLTQSYSGLASMSQKLQRKAKAAGKELPGGPIAALLTLPQGRLALAAIRDLAQRLIVERREFGLSPSSRVRVTADGGGMDADDEILDAVFNGKVECFVPPKLN
jgi:P27 family predicted phage terminase small subunit